jgi:hypothetical protein
MATAPFPAAVNVRAFARALPGVSLFCGLTSVIIAVDPGGVVYRVSDRYQSDRFYHSCPITHIAAMGNVAVFVVDGTVVAASGAHEFPGKRRTIAAEADRIVALAASARFAVAAYATDAGRVVAVSVRTRRVLGEWALRDAVEKLLVTDAWGFVLAKTERRICVLSIAGVEIGSVEFGGKIAHWTAFGDGGADVVALLDADMQLFVFEAFRPETLRCVTKLKKEIVAMAASKASDVLAMIAADGRAVLLPLPLV